MRRSRHLMAKTDLPSIGDVASRLGIRVSRAGKAFCFGGHDKNSPSLSISRDKNVWHCFGCGREGGVIDLVEATLGITRSEALRWLLDQGTWKQMQTLKAQSSGANSSSVRRTLGIEAGSAEGGSRIVHPDTQVYSRLLAACSRIRSDLGREFLRSHGIDIALAEKFGLRECGNHARLLEKLRLEFPFHRLEECGVASRRGERARLFWSGPAIVIPFWRSGALTYLQTRRYVRGPKFVGLPGIRPPVFNLDAIEALRSSDQIFVCEGVPDAIRVSGTGKAALGVLGAHSFTKEIVDRLLRFQVIVVPDGDEAGSQFAALVRAAFRERAKPVLVLRPTPGKDICDLAGMIWRDHG